MPGSADIFAGRPVPLRILVGHEWRLSWRGLVDFVTRRGADGKRQGSSLKLLILIGALLILAHGIAYGLTMTAHPLMSDDPGDVVQLTATLGFGFLLMLSAGLDSAAFTLYSRSDYELLFSSPVPPRAVFVIRAFNVFIFTGAKVFLYGAPFLNVMAFRQGASWLMGYPVLAALSSLATLLAVAIAMALVAIVGIKRTRIFAQVLAALVGLGVFLLLQRDLLLPRSWKIASADIFYALGAKVADWPIFWPAQAMMGDWPRAISVLVIAFAVSAAGLYALAGPFYRASVAVAGAPEPVDSARRKTPVRFGGSMLRTLMSKERKLVLRDPWLLSQILTQSLFLLPLAIIVLQQYLSGAGDATLFVPMFVVLGGQIAGGLTWIALSADDAPDLMGTAPENPRLIRAAKLATICYLTILFVTMPLIIVLMVAPEAGFPALIGMILGAAAAVMINLWHQPRPGPHERRQRKSSNSTLINLAEMIVLMLIAGTVWLVLQYQLRGSLILASVAGIVLIILRMMRRPSLA